MKFSSHLLIGKHVQQYIIEATGVALNLSKFRYGNVHPDIRRNMYGVKHHFDDSKYIIVNILEQIKTKNMNIDDLSFSLGILCHFITDYCCLYHHHTDKYSKNILKHFLYENRLHQVLKKYIEGGAYVLFHGNYNTVMDMVEDIRRQYSKVNGTFIVDASYAIAATSLAVKHIVLEYLSEGIISREPITDNVLSKQVA